MKRVLLCATCVLMAGTAANAADVFLKHAGVTNDEFTLALGEVDIIELWITFEDAPTAPLIGNNVGGGGNNALWVSSGIQLESLMNDNTSLGPNPFVEWATDHGSDGGVPAPGGLSINGRVGTGGTIRFADYNLIYQDAVEGNFNIMVISDGWSAATGLMYHADDIAVRGAVVTAPGTWQKVFHPAGDGQPWRWRCLRYSRLGAWPSTPGRALTMGAGAFASPTRSTPSASRWIARIATASPRIDSA
ncbi:MAG: hypothetical protein IID40_08260 [Planctomycetes bacterium]|nr:hypothetical protein [Planctomycetota bacterium]